MSTKKPSSAEDEYIAKQDALARHKLAVEAHARLAAEEKQRLQQLHHMKCPKCGLDLQSTIFRGVTIDKCFGCNGTWLDAGELETLAGHGGDILKNVVDFFRRS